MKKLRKQLTYANVMSTLAAFLVLGGGAAVAAGQLGEKSVGAKQLRPGAVTARKIRKNAVTAPKIKAEAVKSGKLADSAVKAGKLANAAVTTEKLGGAAVTTEKIAPDAVTGSQLNEASVGQVPSAGRADFATAAESAHPVAFAKVDQDGGVDSSLSKGVSSADVKKGAEINIYCITVPGFSPRGAQVTPEYNGSGGLVAQVTIGGTGSCPAPQVEVRTWNGGVAVKAPFYVALYR